MLKKFHVLERDFLLHRLPLQCPGDRFAWLRDNEFARQTLAGVNPVNIELLKVIIQVNFLSVTFYVLFYLGKSKVQFYSTGIPNSQQTRPCYLWTSRISNYKGINRRRTSWIECRKGIEFTLTMSMGSHPLLFLVCLSMSNIWLHPLILIILLIFLRHY